MSSFQYSPIVLLLLLVSILCSANATTKAEEPEAKLTIYIVHVRPPPPEHTGTDKEWHQSFLPNSSRLLHSFSRALSGFSAKLTSSELDHIRNREGFIHATPSKMRPMLTTHSPSFLHLNRDPCGFWAKSAKYGEGTIIGVLDTGISPTHPSFDGATMPTPPSKWKGTCNFSGGIFPCNNKIIGGRNTFDGKELSIPPYDEHGHGTHVAGIAAGRFVQNASVLGSATGTAAGMAPYAHLAMYKVCGRSGCSTADMVAGIDMALSDGIDVLSISIGGEQEPLYDDHVAVAALSAVKRGAFVAMAGGNSGPFFVPVDNVAPWILTVGASTMDRRIRAIVHLGNGARLSGESAYQPSSIPDFLPLIFPEWDKDADAPYCTNATTLKHIGVEGKIVVCKAGMEYPVEAGRLVKEAGGAAMIFWGWKYDGYLTFPDPHEIPASYVTHADGLIISKYYHKSTKNAKATISFDGTAIGGSSDPAVAAFSSRGPDDINHGILKPDIVGPGVNVLAAAFRVAPSFEFGSGTSMSCPHLAGIAALLKSSHPDWSPAMIKSAIMTTADVTNSGGHHILDSYDNEKASFYAMGAGHVNPVKANNPGLVYDLHSDDYIPYLCGLNYTDDQVRVITSNHTISCGNYRLIDEANPNHDLNYPSITVFLSRAANTAQIRRTLTNVGCSNVTYAAHVHRPRGITVELLPPTLHFSRVGEKQSFRVNFGINATEKARLPSEGYLIWTSVRGPIEVRSPIVVRRL